MKLFQTRFEQALLGCVVLLICSSSTLAQRTSSAKEFFTEHYVAPRHRHFKVGDVDREAFVFAPKTSLTRRSPVVFAFHGHGGTMEKSAEMYGYHRVWSEAIVVYPQGLPTPSPADPKGERPGWAVSSEDKDNRDLVFFDAMLMALERDYKVDRQRIFAAGNSNGGFFTYTLWAARPDVLAGVAPSAATTERLDAKLQPKPVFCTAGVKDDKVSIESQRESIKKLRELNGCGPAARDSRRLLTSYPSPGGTPVVTFIHPGGHSFPTEVTPLIVEFFKAQTLNVTVTSESSDGQK